VITTLLDHLWQSTFFAAGAGLVTLLLKGNAARVRFFVWFAASVKFLVPFAGIAALGAMLLPSHAAPLPMFADLAPAVEPYVVPLANGRSLVAPATPAAALDWTNVLVAVWALGTLAVALRWLSHWMKLRTMLTGAGAVSFINGLSVRRAPAALEPGLFGVFRPVVLLPQDIDTKLSPAELEAVLVHEACHKDHRDNLLIVVHMLVEAMFWFHPLVWWLGARLNHERERACDEAVLAAGQEADVYAESILKVCKLYVQSPLACVAGVSGAGLKERIEHIVMSSVVLPLGAARKLLLAGLATVSLIVPLSAGLVMAPLAVVAQTQVQQARPASSPERIAQLRMEQAAPRNIVAFDPKDFDKFVGKYQFGPAVLMTVTREGSHYLTRLTGQNNVEVFPESRTKFFATIVQAQISFGSDAEGRVNELVLHQNGLEQHAPRISSDAARAIEAALLARLQRNQPSAGTEASLRRYIASLEKGEPNYGEMDPRLAAAVRSQLPGILSFVRQAGELKTLTFKSVNENGMDVYQADFEHARVLWYIAPLTPDGKVVGRGFRPLT